MAWTVHTEDVPHFVLDPEADGMLRVRFSFHPGAPERGPTYDCGGQPEEPPEFEVEEAWALSDSDEPIASLGLAPHEAEAVAEWLAENWEGPPGPDPDAAYEEMRERRWERDSD